MKLSLRILVVGGTFLMVACGGKKQTDYSTTEIKPTDIVFEDVPVTVSMPSGWKDSPLSLPTLKKWEAPQGSFDGPEITVGVTFGMPATVDDAVGQATLGMADGVKRKEKVGDAFVVSTESASGMSYSVHTFVPATEDKALECSVSYIRVSGKIQNIAAQRAWAEKLCLTAKPKAAPEKVQVSTEMNDFLSQFGSATSIGKALKKYGSKGLDTKDMELYDIKSPKVTKTKKNGAFTCYAFDGKAGMTTRSYDVCWAGNKIARIDELGVR